MKISYENNINNYPVLSKRNDNQVSYNNFMRNNQQQSFTGLEQMAERFADNMVANPKVQGVLKGKFLNRFLKMSIENPGLYESFIALLVTCTARPLTILATPGAKMEDKEYASAHSIASGISGLAFAYAAFGPITKAIDNVLINVNGNNVKSAFESFYRDPQNADLISQLVERKIIPDKEAFEAAVKENKNIFGYLKDYLKTNGKPYVDKITASKDDAERKSWSKLASDFSTKLKETFNSVKANDVPERKKYLIHDSLEFMREGAYKLKTSAGADKAKFLINYTSKIILFPLTAGVTIWAIPKIMKLLFPNHRKSKRKGKLAEKALPKENKSIPNNIQAKKTEELKSSTFAKFDNKKGNNISFAGGAGFLKTIAKLPEQAYEKCYQKPLASALSKVFDNIAGSEGFSNRVGTLLSKADVEKYGMKVLDRDKNGKILSKWDNDFLATNLPQIAALFGSCLYIINTIRNKEIDPERKPTLCTNMAVVAVFSLLAGKAIDKVTMPIFDALRKTHSRLMDSKLNYDHEAAWKCARSLLTTTFAFRYLGPVLATPIADKLVKLFGKEPKSHNHKKA